MANRIQLRRGTAAQWAAANPVLAQGEPGIETDTGKQKFGNGVTAWNLLSYASQGPAGPAGAPGVADDASVEDLITTPGTATATALNATYGPSAASLRDAFGQVVTTSHEIPAAFGWPTDSKVALAPTLTTMRGGRVVGTAGVAPKALFARFSQAQANPVNRFYASPAGNDSNAGTFAAPWRSIKKCIEAANAAGASARILVTSGSYLNGQGFEGVSPTVDTAFVAAGGPVLVGNGMPTANYTFASHATYTKTYYINPTPTGGVSRVLDLSRVTEFGNPVELVKVANETICNETPDSYYEGSALYIHRRDGAQPTAANTRVLVTAVNLTVTSEVNVYVGSEDGSPWTMEGSANVQTTPAADPAVAIFAIATPTNAALKAIVAESVKFRFGGEELATTPGNGVSIEHWHGIVAFFNCGADANAKDGFNAHNGLNAATTSLVLTVNCGGDDNGRKAQSANGLTLHENVTAIDVAGRFVRGRGGTVHNIGTSKHYMLGPYVADDLGDIAAGGNIPPAAMMLQNTAQMWIERGSGRMPAGTYFYWAKDAGTKFYLKDCEPVAQPFAGLGTYSNF